MVRWRVYDRHGPFEWGGCMFDFVSTRLAVGYLLLCAASCVGVLQIQAARQPLVGLSLWAGRGCRWWGHPAGLVLIAGSFLTFYACTPGITVPGLAGAELALLFLAGFILALAFTLTTASVVAPGPGRGSIRASQGEAVVAGQLQGRIRLPREQGRRSALCLVPDIGSSPEELAEVSAHLSSLGFLVLSIDWGGMGDPLRYPDVLGLVRAGVDYLLHRPEVHGGHIGVVGFGLGGDLALRAGGADEQIAAVVAVTPCLTSACCNPGLDLLRHQCLWDSVQWIRRHRRHSALVEQLDVGAFLALVPGCPVLLISPFGSSPSEFPSGVDIRNLCGFRTDPRWQREVAHTIGQWCEENL